MLRALPDRGATVHVSPGPPIEVTFDVLRHYSDPTMVRTLTLVVAALTLASALGAQDEGPAEDPTIKLKVGDLKSAARDRKFERDAEAIALIQEFATLQQAGLHKKDTNRIRDALATILTRGRLRKPPELRIYEECAKALEHFGADGAKVLRTAYESKHFPNRDEDWVATRAQLLRSIGPTKDERSVEFLIACIRAAEPLEAAAAGEALACFEKSDEKIRKTITQALVNELAGLESESRRMVPIGADVPQDFGPQNARARLDHVYGPWTSALTKLTGKSFKTAHEWQLWYNEARREDW